MPQEFPIVIMGGNALLAPCLMRRLQAKGYTAEVISRHDVSVPPGFQLTRMDLTEERNWIAPLNAVIISLLPLWILIEFLPRFIGVKAIIAMGSTSRFTKIESKDMGERAVASRLELSEDMLQRWAEKSNVLWTLLRPTLIYDGHSDKNITRMAHFIRRWHFLPLAAPASGLRQPIHADDAASAIMGCLDNKGVYGRAINIAGGEVLSYRDMALRVFASLNVKPRLLMLPVAWLETSFEMVSRVGLVRENLFGASIFQRMNEDQVFDIAEGLRLLDYQPRQFRPEFS